MRAWKQKIKRTATEWLALPPDALLGVSRVSCTNGTDVVVENVGALERVDATEVVLDVGEQKLYIRGREFEVTLVTDKEVHIHGVVESVEYHRNGRKLR